jgi:intracellular sulfur oxidation DsrE/DsrF family protein
MTQESIMLANRHNSSHAAARFIATVFAVLVLSLAPVQAQDSNHAATEGLKEIKVAFDLKQGDPKALLSSLTAIDEMRQSLIEQEVTPSIVLTFRGPASKLVQTDRSEIPAEHREGAAQVAAKLDALRSAEGISSMEQCGLTVTALGLEPQNTIEGVTVVDNSWTTLAAYQAKGYSYIVP